MRNCMMKVTIACLGLLAALWVQPLYAQDVHFSQVELSPLTLNPALAGSTSAFRGIAMYRSQYGSFATPFQTITASLDGKLTSSLKGANGSLGAGINFYNDRMADGHFTQSTVGVNFSYRLKVSRFSAVALGLNTTFGQCATNPAAGQWGTQYDGTAFNPLIPNGEAFYEQNFAYFDLGVGGVYTYQTNNGKTTNTADKGFQVGFSAFHVNNPRYSYYNSSIQTLPIRYSAFINGNIDIVSTQGVLQPAIYYQRQRKANELLYGVTYKQIIVKPSWETTNIKEIAFSLGLFSRFKDAIVIRTGVNYGALTAGFAYDINVSRLSLVSNFKGGFETYIKYDVDQFVRKKLRVK